MKLIKSIALTLAVLSMLLMLVSCDLFSTPQTPGGNGDSNPGGNTNNNTIKYSSLVYTEEGIDLSLVRLEMLDIVGNGVTVNHISSAPLSDSEVVFGDSDRSVTVKAKAALNEAINKSTKYDIGYIVYSDGDSIAVYWQHPDMKKLAINTFIDVCIKDKKLVLEAGTVESVLYEKREFELEKDWLNLSTVAGEEVVAALRSLKDNYESEKLIGWMANLYDSEIGGFYYSISARDNEPFRPDLESTSFILGNVVNHGALTYRDIPDDIKLAILNFVWSTQSKEDGYFYHPQWPQGRENLNTDRYGRDLSWATSIIKNLDLDTNNDGVFEDQYPLYCAPNGDKCASHVNTDKTCSFPVTTAYYASAFITDLTQPLSSGVSAAVSRLSASTAVPVASVSQHPDYSSRAAFSAWLEAYNADIKSNSGHAHQLAALRGEITAKGYSDIVLDHLDRVQKEIFDEQKGNGETPSGLWQREVNYDAVWGLLKYTPYYNDANYGRAINPDYAVYIAQSCVKVILMPMDDELQMNDLYNMWTGVANLISNVRSKNKGTMTTDQISDKLEEIYNVMRTNAKALVDGTVTKINYFKIEKDGSYAYNSDGTTQPKVYGTPVCIGGNEGDANSVHLCCNMYQSIFRCFGYDVIPLYTKQDGEYFIDTLRNCEPIIKNPQNEGTITYDDSSYISKMSYKTFSSEGKVAVEPDPEDLSNNALYFASSAVTGKDSDYITFLPLDLGSECYIFETDLYISSSSDNACLYQISLGEACMIALTKSGDLVTLTVDPDPSSSRNDDTAATKISVESWTRLRIECYVPTEDTDISTPKIKVWLDGELMLVSDKYLGYNSGTFKVGFTGVKFYALRTVNTYVYLDNTFISKEDKVFDATDDSISDSRDEK